MLSKLEIIKSEIAKYEYTTVISPFVEEGDVIKGAVTISEGSVQLKFEVSIRPEYPLQSHGTETIRFTNVELLSYSHVNADGSVCIHTQHCPDIKEKLQIDFEGIKAWIRKYFINRESDSHYEHIVVNEHLVDNEKYVFYFTEVATKFTKGGYGTFLYSPLQYGMNNDGTKINNYIVQSFQYYRRHDASCLWNKVYKALSKQEGLFIYVEEPPVNHERFIKSKWIELEDVLTQEFLSLLQEVKRNIKGSKISKKPMPILIGYRINEHEIHWQCAMIKFDDMPCYGVKIPNSNRYESRLLDTTIQWVHTQNCSYQYFFGRGRLNIQLTEGRILLIGIGAIGSIVATTLTKGGCKRLDIVDYDLKEPGNACRSEYTFYTGNSAKTIDIESKLYEISPFIEINKYPNITDVLKYTINKKKFSEIITNFFKDYDFIIDCSADNDIAYMLDQSKIECPMISLSITNHAKELVCAVSPGMYNWHKEIYSQLNNDVDDLYNPTGCWSPTFKASYNDISMLVHYSIHHINSCLEKELALRSFYITAPIVNECDIKIKQF